MKLDSRLLLATIATFSIASSHVECDTAEARPSLAVLQAQIDYLTTELEASRGFELVDAGGQVVGPLVSAFEFGLVENVATGLVAPYPAVRVSETDLEYVPGLTEQVVYAEFGCVGTPYLELDSDLENYQAGLIVRTWPTVLVIAEGVGVVEDLEFRSFESVLTACRDRVSPQPLGTAVHAIELIELAPEDLGWDLPFTAPFSTRRIGN